MATTKGNKKTRAAATRTKATARGRATKSTTSKKASPRSATSAKTKPAAKAKAVAKPKTVARPKIVAKSVVAAKPRAPKHAAAPKRPGAKPTPAAVEAAELTALKNKFQRERGGLERRLTDAVREIGMLRHHELRAMQFERQVAERDATIERLQAQLTEMQRRPAEPVYVHEIQQSLALVSRDDEAEAAEVDEFEDEQLGDDGDLISDD
jgi:hypothetical protein